MKRLLTCVALLSCSVFVGCEKYDDSALTNRIDNLEERVKTLEELCRQMNTNISLLQTIVTALQNNDYVTGVAPVTKNGETIGYTISFTKSQPVTIYHGKDGKDGQNGTNGTNGADGKDGSTPVIGVKMDDDGIYYWTLNGEWLTDENGNKIKAVGTDGKDGADGVNSENGTNGKDGITPQLKIEEGYWFISYDNGATWTQLGKATGEDGKDGANGQDGTNGTNGTNGVDGDAFFQSVTQDENNVYIVLADGTEITIPKQTALNISFSATSGIACMPGKSVSISYTISGGDDKTSVEAFGDGGWSATIKATSKSEGAIVVTAPEQATAGKVIVLVSDGRGDVIMRSLNFEEGVLSGIDEAYETNWEACTLRVKLQTNLDYTVEIPVDAQSWLSVAESRATLRNETLTFSLTENPDETPRSASVKLIGEVGDVLQSFTIIQKLQPSDSCIVFADANVKKVCVEKYDTNGDGELSYTEATMVTDMPEYFFGDYSSTVQSFEEFYYFINLTTVNNNTFYGCERLTSIKIPIGIKYIGDNAFDRCSRLTSITIPEGVTSIGDWAFYDCSSLTSIKIPESVTSIGVKAFYGCWSLISITLPDRISAIGRSLFYGCSNLTSIVIPESVSSIDDYAFAYCSKLSSITIPEGVTSIGNNAFMSCTRLVTITLPQSVVSIGKNTFCGCKELSNINLPISLLSIGDYAFNQCTNLLRISLPDNLTSIGKHGFEACTNLISITIPKGITSIEDSTFSGCSSLSSITLPDNVTDIGDYAFKGCDRLTSIILPSSVTTIGNGVFYGCSKLTDITIPDGISSIMEYAFWSCSNLLSITLPETITSIGNSAFLYCASLTSVYCRAITPPSLGDNYVFVDNNYNRKIYVPASDDDSIINAYKAAEGWKEYASAIEEYEFD